MNPRELPNRKSIRLKGYDYSSPGFYFVTICAQNMEHMFGDVIDGEMVLNDFGEISWDLWNQIDSRYENTNIHEFVIMPNHVHGIIEIINDNPFVGAIHESPLQRQSNLELYRKYRRKMLIPKIIGWYKMNTAKQINQIRKMPGSKLWQRGYYDHIIRNEESLYRIREYIINNPKKWSLDRFHINVQ